MATETERLKREIATLELKRAEHERNHQQAQARKIEIENKRRPLQVKIAEGDDSALRDLQQLDAERAQADMKAEAFAAAESNVVQQLDLAKNALANAERDAAIHALDNQIAALAPLDNEVETALANLAEKSKALFDATTEVATQLRAMDEQRFDSAFGNSLTSQIRVAIIHRLEELNFPGTERRPAFLEIVGGRLRAAIKQLKYEGLKGNVVPKAKERLYVTKWRISGVRDLDLKPGSRVALTETEAAEFVESGCLELVEQADTATP
jgi:hypothetical protein